MIERERMVCSFCNTEIKPPLDGMFSKDTNQYICTNCVKLCYKAMMSAKKREQMDLKQRMTPREIKAELDKAIIGQEDAKMAAAIAVYQHYKRMDTDGMTKLAKSNILMIGPTGCGKTLLAQTVAEMLDVPFAIADCTTLTEAGYVGDDVESILFKLIQAADGDIKKAERGIIFLDEFDKIASMSVGANLTKDPSGTGVQQGLLKLVEGTVTNVAMHSGRKNPAEQTEQVNTENILFICSGAFEGLSEIIEKRICGSAGIGFGAEPGKKVMDKGETLKSVETEDLIRYGLIPELVGRLPVIVTLEDLDEDALVDILTKPEGNIIGQYQEMFALDQIELEFTPGALREIAQEALKKKTGARGLRGIIERILKESMFELPSDKEVTRCIVHQGGKIQLVRNMQRMAC